MEYIYNIYTRCMYSQCIPRAHLHDLWTNTCGLVGMTHAFGTVGHACATKCEKCEKEGKVYTLRWKSSRMWVCLRTAQNTKIWWFLKMTTHFIAMLGAVALSLSSFSKRTLRHWGCIYVLSSPPFSRQAPSSFFPAPVTTFSILTSWQWDC